MNETLKRVKDIVKDGCLTIILNTHRTKPDSQKDPIKLKNLIKEARTRLEKGLDKREVKRIMNNLEEVAGQIDHSHNLDSLILFANSDFADYTRLPVTVNARVVVDDNFATRDLIRAMNQQAGYRIVVLSRQKARLIEAFNDKVVAEIKEGFPIENNIYTTDKHKLSTARGQDNLIEEFFNQVDKMLSVYMKEDPLPLIVATESRNFDHFKKVTANATYIAGHINRNRDKDEAHQIVSDAWTVMREVISKREQERISELRKAVASGMVMTDYNDIWKAIHQGRGSMLFVKKGFFQPALLNDGEIAPVSIGEREQNGYIDDIVDEMIELNRRYGGDTIFIENDDYLTRYRVALVTRF